MIETVDYDGRQYRDQPILRHSYLLHDGHWPTHMLCVYFGPPPIRPLTATAERCPKCDEIVAWMETGEPDPPPESAISGLGLYQGGVWHPPPLAGE